MLQISRKSAGAGLRHVVASLAARHKSTNAFEAASIDQSQIDFGARNSKSSPADIPFSARRHSETFGQLVRSEHCKKSGDLNDTEYTKKIELNSKTPYDALPSPFRNEDGSFIQGSTSEEARLDPLTLEGRVDHAAIKLPEEIAKVINQNILLAVSPDKLRERSAVVYQSLEREQIQKAPELSLEADAHIASLFLQDFAHARRALLELKKRVGPSFNPQSILDVGYGPGTGMVALNDIMGDDFAPKTKEVYVVGRSNKDMKSRAKIILSRQLCEVPESESQDSGVEAAAEPEPTQEDQDFEGYSNFDEADYIGPVDASQIEIRTKLRDALPSTKQYELIIVNQALLTREYHFPADVDTNIHMLLRLLKPNGHLVLVERGNALGFEIIARARQIMLRPEAYEGEQGTIPRPYIKGSTYKPQKLRKEDQLITEDHIKYEEELLAQLESEDLEEELAQMSEANEELEEGLESEITAKYGEVTEDELKFEFEDSEDFDVVPLDQADLLQLIEPSSDKVNFHLSVVAPCTHHARCPLQLGNPNLYKVSNHKHRLKFCSFNQVVERPKYTMELKRGRRLATSWDKGAQDGMGIDTLSKHTLKTLEGSGRPGGNNTEAGNFSYLIIHRSPNDAKHIEQIESDREHHVEVFSQKQSLMWPRILEFPSKIKNNVKLNVCAPSGNVETWQVPKSLGKQTYHDARKVRQGDLWALGKKSAVVKNRMSSANLDKLNRLAATQRKFVIKEKRKKQWKKVVSRSEDDFEEDPLNINHELASELEQSKKYRVEGKRADFDVDPRKYDGN